MKKTIIITTYICFLIAAYTGGFLYATKDVCWEKSTDGKMGIYHRVKC